MTSLSLNAIGLIDNRVSKSRLLFLETGQHIERLMRPHHLESEGVGLFSKLC